LITFKNVINSLKIVNIIHNNNVEYYKIKKLGSNKTIVNINNNIYDNQKMTTRLLNDLTKIK
jgi:hypothetical protein